MSGTVAAIAAGLLTACLVVLLIGRRRPVRRWPATNSAGQDEPIPVMADRRLSARKRHLLRVGGGLVGFALFGPVGTAALITGAVLVSRWRRLRAASRLNARRRDALPELIESLVVLIESGCTPTRALHEISRHAPPVLRPALAEVIAHLDVGVRLSDALGLFIDHVGESARLLVDSIVRAEIYGDPLGPLLLRLHDEATRQRRHRAEIAARQLPIRLCFPLVCCTLPSFALLTIVPLLAGAFSSLRQSSY